MNGFQPVGPFKEGDPLTIMCVATGGEPPPSVLWYKENQIIDRSCTHDQQTKRQMLTINCQEECLISDHTNVTKRNTNNKND